MINIRKSNERGHANYGWLDTHYTFSFSTFYDPKFMGFRDLRVINEDFIEPNQGFPTHGHKDMEIISYVIQGELSHKDSMGNGETIYPNEVQRMTAGKGVQHSEYSSPTEKTHLLQIWILPEKNNLEPEYEQTFFSNEDKTGKLKLVASRGGKNDSVHVNQDVVLYSSILNSKDEITYELADDRYGWIQLIKGSIEINGEILKAGDGAAISEENKLTIKSLENNAEFILFDLN